MNLKPWTLHVGFWMLNCGRWMFASCLPDYLPACLPACLPASCLLIMEPHVMVEPHGGASWWTHHQIDRIMCVGHIGLSILCLCHWIARPPCDYHDPDYGGHAHLGNMQRDFYEGAGNHIIT